MSVELMKPRTDASLPSVFTVEPQAKKRMRDFFSSHIHNKNTRRAYMEAVRQFSAFCADFGFEVDFERAKANLEENEWCR